MSKRTPSSDSPEKTKTIKWNWNKDAFINDQQTQYPGIRVESMFEGVGRLVYEVESLIDAVIRWYAYSAHRFSDNRAIITEKELDSHEFINELDVSIFVKVMWEIAGKAKIGSKDDADTLKEVLRQRDYFLHVFYHEYHKKRLEAGWMDEKINQLKAALVLAYGLTSKYEEAVEFLVTGINKPKKSAKKAVEAEETSDVDAESAEDADGTGSDVDDDSEEVSDVDDGEDSEDEDDEDDGDEDEEDSYERPVRDYGYQRRDGDRQYGDHPRNNYNRGGDRRNGGYNRNGGNRDRKPYGDRPRNNYGGDRKPYGDRPRNNYGGDRKPYGDRPRNNYNRDGPRDRKPYGDKPRYDRDGPRDGYQKKRPYKPREGSGDRD